MLHSLIIAAAVIAGIAVLVYFLISITRRQQRQRKELLRVTLGNLLMKHRMQPDLTDEYEHRIIALDSTRRMLAFVQHDEASPTLALDLRDVADCRLWKECNGVSFTGSSALGRTPEHVSAIGLLFVRHDADIVKLPLYTEILDGIGERQALEKAADDWRRRILTLRAEPALKTAL